MMLPIYVREETRAKLSALAAPGENYDALLARLVDELARLRAEAEARALVAAATAAAPLAVRS